MVVARNDRAGGFKPIPKPLPQLPPDVIQGKPLPHCPVPVKPPTFDQKDANKDGKLNADEFETGRSVLDKFADSDKFDRYDSDNDGYVTKQENLHGVIGDALRKSTIGLPDLGSKLKRGFDPDPGIRVTPKPEKGGPKDAEADAFKLGLGKPNPDAPPGL